MKVVLAISILFSVFAINSGHIVLPGFSIGIGSGGIGIGIGHGNGYGYGNGYGNGYGSGYGNGYGYGSGYGNGYGYRPWGSFRRRRALHKIMKWSILQTWMDLMPLLEEFCDFVGFGCQGSLINLYLFLTLNEINLIFCTYILIYFTIYPFHAFVIWLLKREIDIA